MLIVYVPPSELTRFGAGLSGGGDILVPQIVPPEEIKEIWIARNCFAEPDAEGIRRFVITKPFKIFSKQLSNEIVTYADFQTLGRPGKVATREQVIDGAVQLIKRFPEPPIGDPEDLRSLKEDVEESASILAVCLNCKSEFWSAGRYEKTNPDGAIPNNKAARDKIRTSAEEAMRKAKEMFEKMSKEDEKLIEEEDKDIEEKAKKDEERKASKEEEQASFAREEPTEKEEVDQSQKEDLSMFERDLKLPEEGAMCVDSNLQAAKYLLVHLMNQINKSFATWWKYNIATDRKGKIELWKSGFRPDVTGGGFPFKPIDPQTGEPGILTDLEYLDKLRGNQSNKKLLKDCEHIAARAYPMRRFIHKIRWAIYRIGMNQQDLAKMIEQNRVQTENQKTRRRMLGGSAEVVEKVMKTILVQNDPSYATMCKLIKLVSGCETFSVLSHMKTDSKHLSIDMEALVGDPMNILVDQEVVLLLNQYGFSDLDGPSGKYLRNLKRGTAELHRQIVENEDYQRMVPQLKHAAHDPKDASQEKDSYGSGSRPRELTGAQAQNPGKSPRVFAPGGVSYEPPKSDKPAERPEVTLRPNSANVGASAKHLAKARPESPAPKTMPEPSSSSSQRQPPQLPLPTRRQTEGGGQTTYASEQSNTTETAQSSQTPINPQTGNQGWWSQGNWNKGWGKGKSRGSGKSRCYSGGWEYYAP